MATPKLLLSKLLRRRRPQTPTPTPISSSVHSYSSNPSSSSSIFSAQSSNVETPKKTISRLPLSTVHPLSLRHSFAWSRSLSTRRDSECGPDLSPDSGGEEKLLDSGFSSSSSTDAGDVGGSDIAEALVSASDVGGDGEPFLLARALISLLDLFHDSTGWPWWVVIASSTVALRITLLPMLILQLKKLKKIAESLSKLPPPLPPPLSGRSYSEQFSLFRRERRAVGCPSYLWLLSFVSVQAPCFLLWMTTLRRMSLDHHPGFDSGGTLWFQNLTNFPHLFFGSIFPLLIASLHFANIQISFRTSSMGKATGVRSLPQYYQMFLDHLQYCKIFLDNLTLPILFIGFYMPQGGLVYWVTNSSLTLVQQLCLNQPGVRKILGLPDKVGPVPPASRLEMDTPGETQEDMLRKQQEIPLHHQHLSPRELLFLSLKYLAEDHNDRAMPLLRLALHKDPEYVRALVVMGMTLLDDGQLAEAADYLERAISKLFLSGHPTEVEEVDLLILASLWAGIACIRQGKTAKGIRHLERVANLKEPEDAKSKAHYYYAFLVLASALYNERRRLEAVKLLRMAAAYDSSYNVYLEQCEKDEVDLVRNLDGSKRGDN